MDDEPTARPGPAVGDDHDVAVIGGGAAGLAAALTLARSVRSVVVIDAGAPRNAPAAGVHAFLTRDGTAPGELLAIGREEVRRYGGRFLEGRVHAVSRRGDGRFAVAITHADRERTVTVRRIVLATGITDVLPAIPGLAERWGEDVVHCPFCHGWEVRGRRIGVLATGPAALHQAALFAHLASSLLLFTHTADGLDADELRRSAAAGVEIVDGEVTAVTGEDGRVAGVELGDGRVVEVGAVVVAPRFEVAEDLLAAVGLTTVEHASGLGRHVPVAPDGATEVAGVWAAGNLADPMAQVIAAAAQGNTVGARVHADMLVADRHAAVAA